jgi:hypothetical protein
MSMRQITILALMCLISHNLFVETAIQKKTGSSAFIMFFLRLCTSIVGAFILNLILPDHIGSSHVIQKSLVFGNMQEMLTNWILSAGQLSLKMSLIISGLMILQSILKEFDLLDKISRLFAPLMRIMGLTNDSSFLWFVAQSLGLGYGSAVMFEEIDNKSIKPAHANLLNYHIAINHSLLEDTLLFVAIGVPAGWIIAPRVFLAMGVVWSVRLILKFKVKKKVESIIPIQD